MSELSGVVVGTTEAVVVEGGGAGDFLQSLLSQDLHRLGEDRGVRSFLLGPQGKLRALLWVARRDQAYTLFTDAGIGERVAADLRHYKIRARATISEPLPAFEVFGFEVGLRAGWRTVDRYLSLEPLDLPQADRNGREAARIEAGEPVMDLDVDEKTIPQETGLIEEAVSFTKGCFLGQELVARLDARHGRVNRQLRGLALDGPVSPGTDVVAGQDPAGAVTSVAWSDRFQSYVGLSLLRRGLVSGDHVKVGAVAARVIELPFAHQAVGN